MFLILALLNCVNSQYPEFCYGRFDGTYCNGNYLFTCVRQQTYTYQACTFCTQTTSTQATCSSYQVPQSYCSTRVNGWSCYSSFGSSIYTSVWCDNNVVLQQQVCGSGFSSCDSFSGRCTSTGNGGSNGGQTTCSPSCTNGCNYDGSCKLPSFCSVTQVVNGNSAPFCSTYISGRSVDSKLSIPLQDQNANKQNTMLANWRNISYSSGCLNYMKQFSCESNFLNCLEKQSKYTSCQVVCQNVYSCMQSESLNDINSQIAQLPLDCISQCSSSTIVSITSQLLLLLALFFVAQ